MPAKYIPTAEDCTIIRSAAAREANLTAGAVILEPGYRWGPHPERGSSLNIALVSDDPAWGDTDLADYGTWSEFRKGIELTSDGRAIVDFYIRRKFDSSGELHGNIVCHVRNGVLAEIRGYGHGGRPLWTAPQRMRG